MILESYIKKNKTKSGATCASIGITEALKPPILDMTSKTVKYLIIYLLSTKFMFSYVVIVVPLYLSFKGTK